MWSHNAARFLLLVLLGVTSAGARVAPGDSFPALGSAGLSGGEPPATAGHVLLVDFWASWCAPCRASFAGLARLQQEFASRGLLVIAVSVDENPAAYAAAVRQWQPPFPALLDARQQLVRAVEVPAMPTSYLIGRDGRIRYVHSGFHGRATEAEWRTHVATLLAEETSRP